MDALMLRKMFLTGAKVLELNKEWINELNVFPVPDGDTGTNMTLTVTSAVKAGLEIPDPDMASIAKAISSGSLRGARGNSGVILSQLFRGFAKVIREHDELNAQILAESMQRGVETAYKAVMKPKEGTILTVAKAVGDKAAERAAEVTDLALFFDEIVKEGDKVLSETPEMLPVLKEAGVVDSGGQGLMEILHGALDAFKGKEMDLSFGDSSDQAKAAPVKEEKKSGYGYCAECIITPDKPLIENEIKKFRDYLAEIGDSIILVPADGSLKMHVHTNDPGLAIQKALSLGSITSTSIDNISEEHSDSLFTETEREQLAKKEAYEPKEEMA